MSALRTEFTAINDFVMDEAYGAACRFVERQRSVEIVDVRELAENSLREADISIFAARHAQLKSRGGMKSIKKLVLRQNVAPSLTLVIASCGNPSIDEVDALSNAIGLAPVGAARWVVPIADADDLYKKIVRWLLIIVDLRTRSGARSTTPATSTAAEIDGAQGFSAGNSAPMIYNFPGVP